MTVGNSYGRFLKRFARFGAQLSVGVGIATMIGWFLDIALLKSLLPGFASMKMNTACGFLAAGASLWLPYASERGGKRLGSLALGLAAFVAALGGLTLTEIVFGIHLGIDQILIHDNALNPGQMSPASAFNFAFVGLALLSLRARSTRLAGLAAWLVIPPLMISMLAIIGYAYGVRSLYQVSIYTTMALHTALVFFILSLSILAADSKHGFALIASSNTAGGMMSRWMLPIIPGALFFLGWIRLKGQQAGYYDFEFGLALMVSSSITVCVIVAAWTANIIHHTDLSRRERESEIIGLNSALAMQRSEERISALLNGIKDYAIITMDTNGLIESWNVGAERIKGYKAHEIIGQSFSKFYTPEEAESGKPAAELVEAIATGKFEEEGWRLRKDKSRFWANVLITPRWNDNGELSGFSKITRDFTDRKTAEALLAEKLKELNNSNEKLGRANRRLEVLADRDGLTGLANRRFFDEALVREWKAARRDETCVGLIMIDVDWFKRFNDRYGHLAGDECLRQVAKTIETALRRPRDMAARYGGEEFVVLLPDTGDTGTAVVAERIRQSIFQLAIVHIDNANGIVTVSAGVASTEARALENPGALAHLADRALYRAKEEGRNRVARAPEVVHLALAQLVDAA